MPSALEHPEVVTHSLGEEGELGRLLGSFRPGQIPGIQINRIGVIPKGKNTSRWPLITDIFFPNGYSINDGFRAGELTVPTETAFNARIHLAWGDVATDQASPPTMICVHLQQSKCDQGGKGVDVYLGRTDTDVCPVQEVINYVTIRGPTPGPFFRLHSGTPLTKTSFVSRVREALRSLDKDPQIYAGHSFRIGAATAAARTGLEDTVIQSLGRWSSDAFRRYIRTPRERLARCSRDLATEASIV